MPTTESTSMPCTDQHSEDDATLVRRAVDGDTEAFESLMCRHSGKLFRLARGIVESDSDADDVWQRAMVKMHDKLDTLRNPDAFTSWAYRLVRNEALMATRREKRSDEVGFGDLGEGHDDERHFESLAPEWRSRADEAFETTELRGQLADAVDELEAKYQSPFVLYEFEGYSFDEIAELLDLSRGGVKTRIHRARKRLRTELERYLREDLETMVA